MPDTFPLRLYRSIGDSVADCLDGALYIVYLVDVADEMADTVFHIARQVGYV